MEYSNVEIGQRPTASIKSMTFGIDLDSFYLFHLFMVFVRIDQTGKMLYILSCWSIFWALHLCERVRCGILCEQVCFIQLDFTKSLQKFEKKKYHRNSYRLHSDFIQIERNLLEELWECVQQFWEINTDVFRKRSRDEKTNRMKI